MKIKISIILILFCFANSSLGQTYTTMQTDADIYHFLNWLSIHDKKYEEEPKFKSKHISCFISAWDSSYFIFEDTAQLRIYPLLLGESYLFQKYSGLDTLFKPADRNFLFQQFIAIKDTVWRQSFSHSKLFCKKNPKVKRHYYSIPLFSKDQKYVLVRKEFYCCDSCAYGGVYIYRKMDAHNWEYVTCVNTYLS